MPLPEETVTLPNIRSASPSGKDIILQRSRAARQPSAPRLRLSEKDRPFRFGTTSLSDIPGINIGGQNIQFDPAKFSDIVFGSDTPIDPGSKAPALGPQDTTTFFGLSGGKEGSFKRGAIDLLANFLGESDPQGLRQGMRRQQVADLFAAGQLKKQQREEAKAQKAKLLAQQDEERNEVFRQQMKPTRETLTGIRDVISDIGLFKNKDGGRKEVDIEGLLNLMIRDPDSEKAERLRNIGLDEEFALRLIGMMQSSDPEIVAQATRMIESNGFNSSKFVAQMTQEINKAKLLEQQKSQLKQQQISDRFNPNIDAGLVQELGSITGIPLPQKELAGTIPGLDLQELDIGQSLPSGTGPDLDLDREALASLPARDRAALQLAREQRSKTLAETRAASTQPVSAKNINTAFKLIETQAGLEPGTLGHVEGPLDAATARQVIDSAKDLAKETVKELGRSKQLEEKNKNIVARQEKRFAHEFSLATEKGDNFRENTLVIREREAQLRSEAQAGRLNNSIKILQEQAKVSRDAYIEKLQGQVGLQEDRQDFALERDEARNNFAVGMQVLKGEQKLDLQNIKAFNQTVRDIADRSGKLLSDVYLDLINSDPGIQENLIDLISQNSDESQLFTPEIEQAVRDALVARSKIASIRTVDADLLNTLRNPELFKDKDDRISDLLGMQITHRDTPGAFEKIQKNIDQLRQGTPLSSVKVDVNLPAPESRVERKAITSLESLVDEINLIARDYQSNFVGRLDDIIGSERAKAGQISAKEAKFRARVSRFKAKAINLLAGANISPAEIELYLASVVSLDQGEQAFKANLELSLEDSLRFLNKTRASVGLGTGERFADRKRDDFIRRHSVLEQQGFSDEQIGAMMKREGFRLEDLE